jgi:hypothetical protein
MTPTDQAALELAVAAARKDPAEARRIDHKLARGDDWLDIATSCAYHCQMVSLGLLPWQSPPCTAHITEPRRDERAIALLHHLLAAGLSRYEPDPVAALERAEAERAKNQPAK